MFRTAKQKTTTGIFFLEVEKLVLVLVFVHDVVRVLLRVSAAAGERDHVVGGTSLQLFHAVHHSSLPLLQPRLKDQHDELEEFHQ